MDYEDIHAVLTSPPLVEQFERIVRSDYSDSLAAQELTEMLKDQGWDVKVTPIQASWLRPEELDEDEDADAWYEQQGTVDWVKPTTITMCLGEARLKFPYLFETTSNTTSNTTKPEFQMDIRTTTFVNGTDVANMTESQFISAINDVSDEIDKLTSVNKRAESGTVTQRIAELTEKRTSLVELMDSRFAKTPE